MSRRVQGKGPGGRGPGRRRPRSCAVRVEGPEGLVDHQVRLALQSSDPAAPGFFPLEQVLPGGAGLRVLDGDGSRPLPFWVESWDDAARTAVLWLRAPSVPGTVRLCWGNADAAARSDGEATFELFDDFETPFLQVYRTNLVGGEPAVLCEPGAGHLRMWYTGPGNRIHHARSEDGVRFDTCPTDVPEGYLRSAVLEKDGLYYLYCAAQDRDIHLFTSRDGVHFLPRGVALAGGVGGDGYVANMFVWEEGGTWHMLYEAGRDGGPGAWAICLATAASPTGFTAGRTTANPVMTAPGAGCGNPELARAGSRVLRHRGRYWMLYHRGENWRAWSTDLRTWTQEGVVWGYDRADPEGYSCGDGALGEFGGRTYLWKSLSDQVADCRMAVAVANLTLPQFLETAVPLSAARWEDAAPDGGYPRLAGIDVSRARSGHSSLFLHQPSWGRPRGVAMRRTCRLTGPVAVGIWLHDDLADAPGRGHVGIRGADGCSAGLGVDTELDAGHYVVVGGGVPATAAARRTAGWHCVEFEVDGDGTEVRLDGVLVGRQSGLTADLLDAIEVCSDPERPLHASVDSVTVRRLARPVPRARLAPGLDRPLPPA